MTLFFSIAINLEICLFPLPTVTVWPCQAALTTMLVHLI